MSSGWSNLKKEHYEQKKEVFLAESVLRKWPSYSLHNDHYAVMKDRRVLLVQARRAVASPTRDSAVMAALEAEEADCPISLA